MSIMKLLLFVSIGITLASCYTPWKRSAYNIKPHDVTVDCGVEFEALTGSCKAKYPVKDDDTTGKKCKKGCNAANCVLGGLDAMKECIDKEKDELREKTQNGINESNENECNDHKCNEKKDECQVEHGALKKACKLNEPNNNDDTMETKCKKRCDAFNCVLKGLDDSSECSDDMNDKLRVTIHQDMDESNENDCKDHKCNASFKTTVGAFSVLLVSLVALFNSYSV